MELSLIRFQKAFFQLITWTVTGLLINIFFVHDQTGGLIIIWVLCFFFLIPSQQAYANYQLKQLNNDELSELNQELKLECNSRQSVIESLQIQVKKISSDNDSLSNTITSLHDELKLMDRDYKSLEVRCTSQQDRLTALNKSLNDASASLAEANILIEEKDKKIQSLTNSNNRLKGLSKKQNEEI